MSSPTQRKSQGYIQKYHDISKNPVDPGSTTESQPQVQHSIVQEGDSKAGYFKVYQGIPSIAEAAEQLHHELQYQSTPSIAEVAEPLLGGGEPVPYSTTSEGTASQSVIEQIDIDREVPEWESHQNVPKESTSEGREESGDQGVIRRKIELQQVPGATESLRTCTLATANQKSDRPDEQMPSQPQESQRGEKPGEPGATESQGISSVSTATQRPYSPEEHIPSKVQEFEASEASTEAARRIDQEKCMEASLQKEERQPEIISQANRTEIGQRSALGPAQKQPDLPKGKQNPITNELEHESDVAQQYETGELHKQKQQKQLPQQEQPQEQIQRTREMLSGRQQEFTSAYGPPDRKPEELQSHQQRISPNEQARLFYAQGEGNRCTFEKQQYQQPHSRHEQCQVSLGSHEKPSEYIQAEPREDQRGKTYTEVQASTEGKQSDLQETSVQGLPQTGTMVSEFAKMQFPPEQFEKPEISQKQGVHEQPDSKDPQILNTEFNSKPVGIRAESGHPEQFEYLPQAKDVRFHSWGQTKEIAFENMANCMFNYIANVEKVDVDPKFDFQFRVIGENDKELLYKFLDELLFRFNARKQLICKQVVINQLGVDEDGCYRLVATGHGEPYNKKKHGSGTEIKAVTLPSLEINEQPERTEAFVLMDI